MVEFPKDFFWGAATSAYQVEGNNINSDWWEWEKRTGLKETSGEACRHYELYQCDFDLASNLNHNCHRLSVEWSRIEPQEGRFSALEIQHYKEVMLSLKERHLEPIVTLHHFTNPGWFAQLGGWQNKRAAFYFLRYAEKIVGELAEHVRYWVTINEPLVYVYHAYLLGLWPPQEKSLCKARIVTQNLASSHIQAYRLIHRIYKGKSRPSPLVSIAKNMQAFLPCTFTLRNRIATYLRNRYFNFEFIERLIGAKTLDFIGVNYYTRGLVETQGWGLKNLLLDACNKNHSQLKKNSLGWDIYPQGLYNLLLGLKKYNLPIFILENGISTEDDNLRWDFISEHLKNIHLAMTQGTKVLGYIYWSLIDNFEWDKGLGPRFGLIEVDYHTYKRSVRESAKRFSLVCKTGRLD
jgi:beta-glucosidase